MSDDVKKQIMAELWKLDSAKRRAASAALEAIYEQQRPAREALHAWCGEATGHSMTTIGNTVGGLAYGHCVWCSKSWREKEEP